MHGFVLHTYFTEFVSCLTNAQIQSQVTYIYRYIHVNERGLVSTLVQTIIGETAVWNETCLSVLPSTVCTTLQVATNNSQISNTKYEGK